MSDGDGINGRWRLDRSIPVAFLFIILAQTGGVAWWAATMQERVETVEQAVEQRREERDRIVALEVEIKAVHTTLRRIESSLNRSTGALTP